MTVVDAVRRFRAFLNGTDRSVRPYRKNNLDDETYPKLNNGDEYYVYRGGRPVFAEDGAGRPRYARDGDGNERYPPRGGLRDRVLSSAEGDPLYAKDSRGDGLYPRAGRGRRAAAERVSARSGRLRRECVPAEYASGRQKYPRDAVGNEYFPVVGRKKKKARYLLNEIGEPYEPETARGFKMYLTREEALVAGEEEEENVLVVFRYADAFGSEFYTRDPFFDTERLDKRLFKRIYNVTFRFILILF